MDKQSKYFHLNPDKTNTKGIILLKKKKKKSLTVQQPRFELVSIFQICVFYYTSFEKLYTVSKPGIKNGFLYEGQL